MNKIDKFLNKLTMYRLLVWGLGLLAITSIASASAGILKISAADLSVSLILYIVMCYLFNKLFSYIWRAPTNTESWLITALILFFIMQPDVTRAGVLGGLGACLVAISSKFILSLKRKHIFNPAALAAVVGGVTGISFVSWWVGNTVLALPLLVLGLLVIRKTRKEGVVLTYFIAAVITYLVVKIDINTHGGLVIKQFLFSSPLVFLGAIMLTEPATLPSGKRWLYIFAALVGALSVAQIRFGEHLVTAELALLLGNLLAYVTSPRYKARLVLKQTTKLPGNVYDLAFTSDIPLAFRPGQYMDFTLPHSRTDNRGNRRAFTMASSPTEREIHVGVKVYEPSSSYKKALLAMKPGDSMVAGQISGNFTLPVDVRKKLVFIAGGIGVTPFRSMAKNMIDIRQSRDAILFYMISNPDELSYREVFDAAKPFGLRTLPVLFNKAIPASWKGETGLFTTELLKKYVPDARHRTYYISGPPRMVDSCVAVLKSQGIHSRQIITDHFSGY